ncbi:DUF2207 domain-containing protein [Devosia lacusdianchii]|uniref:DUF2207 domain-containing protein n=1 Tax=Devosia lacusdianchii TaxID=2917991 RepID=UPI001F0649A9|nr:DUF2207 domain-containing protein [Devosia sp. JXJ CY 41]
MRLVRLFVAALLGLLLALPAAAREEIRGYTSDIVIAVDGSATVTETIEVTAEGNEIRRGIYRDIPVILLSSDGGKVRPRLEVTNVQRDGQAETYRVERMGDFQRIWIGDPERYVDRGPHRYVITYTMDRVARSFADHDEIYWNATGNYWIFPILNARATVRLPDGAVITQLAGYTGVVGSTEQAVATKRTSDTTATFRSSRALGAGEGMTIAVAFNKGIIAFPTGFAAFTERLSDLREVILPVLAALLAIAYNALAWFRVGRDPEKGVIIPLFHPPKGFSPPLVHYVHKWGFEKSGWTALTSAIFDLGVKGLVTIDNAAGSLRLKMTGKQPEEALPAGEKIVFDYLSTRPTTVIDKTNGPEWAKRRGEFTAAIETENRALWFRNNTGYSVFGFLLAVALLGAMVFSSLLDPGWLVASVFAGIMLASVGGLARKMLAGQLIFRAIIILWIFIMAINFFGLAIDTFTSAAINVASISAISIVVITIVFAVVMRAPTVQGRKVMDQIDGFKLYIETAEKERLNMESEPPMTVSRFERILPYAIALGVEKPWSDHFDAELARNAVSDASSGYSPSWYHGSTGSFSQSASNVTSAVSAAAASMTAAMVAAQPVQSSSSGFSSGGGGGGGSSGGGGGGGGGGGW